MTSRNRTRIISAGLITTPFIGLVLGLVAWMLSSHVPNADGVDLSKILLYAGFVVGFIGSALGLVLGLVANVLSRKATNKDYLVAIYLLPCGAAVFYILYLIIVNS